MSKTPNPVPVKTFQNKTDGVSGLSLPLLTHQPCVHILNNTDKLILREKYSNGTQFLSTVGLLFPQISQKGDSLPQERPATTKTERPLDPAYSLRCRFEPL